mgnify:CR=1 FL=1
MRFKDFKDLPKIKPPQTTPSTPKGSSSSSGQGPGTSKEQQAEANETGLFLQAMQDVAPLKDSGKGRKVSARTPISNPKKISEGEKGKQYLEDLVQGKVEFDIEFTTEYLQGAVRGLNQKTLRQLKAGEFSPEAHLDLHGLNSYDAHHLLISFIKEHYLSGKRCLLIIPGRGKNSPSGRGILREHVQQWLIRDPLKRVLLAFTTAQPQHGGAGALYLLLRKYKKGRGKVFWDRYDLNSDI